MIAALKALACVFLLLAFIVVVTLGIRKLQRRSLLLQKNKNPKKKDSCCS